MTVQAGDMKITAIAPWFGGKRTLAPRIVAELGSHKSYYEPFCGSMAVLFAKAACRQETVNDLHGAVINLARVLASPLAEALYERLRRTLFCESLHADAKAYCGTRCGQVPAPDPEWAYWYFVEAWMGRNGTAGTDGGNSNFCARYTIKGGDNGTRFVSAVESIPAWHARLRRVYILCRDGFALLASIPDEVGYAVYVDPPYLVKGARYVHDFSEQDHQRLAAALARFSSARVVVSYYDHPQLAQLYPAWRQERFDVSKATAHCGRRGDNPARATEVLLVNGPPLADSLLSEGVISQPT